MHNVNSQGVITIAGCPAGRLSARVVSTVEEMRSLEGVWDHLLDRSPDRNIFLTWEWLNTWWRHFGRGKHLSVLVVRERDQVRAIVPLMAWHYNLGFCRLEVLENIGSTSVDYGGIVHGADAEAIEPFVFDWLQDQVNRGKLVIFNRVPEDSKFLGLLRKRANGVHDGFDLYVQPDDICPNVMINGNYVPGMARLFMQEYGERFPNFFQLG